MVILKQSLYSAILIIALVGLYGTYGLVRVEWLTGNACPKLLGIPACYIIVSCFALAIISHLGFLKDKRRIFWLGVLPALAIASYGSMGELFNFASCPKTSGGIPMCYISLAMFGSLAFLKFFLTRVE